MARTARLPTDVLVNEGDFVTAGQVLNVVNLADVYMTFFLPTAEAGRVQMGSEVRVVLDAAPHLVIPAQVTFVANVAQLTPKPPRRPRSGKS